MTLTRGSLAGRFLALVERSRDILVLIDPQGTVEYANRALEDLLGYRPTSVVGRSIFALLGDSEMQSLSEAVYRVVIESAPAMRLEQSVRDRRGAFHHFDVMVERAELEPATEVIVLTAHDVTKHRQIEEELRSSEELYRTIFESSVQGVSVVQDERIVAANAAAAAVMGIRHAELLRLDARELFALVHPDDLQRVLDFFAGVMAAPDRVRHARYRQRHRNGDVRWVDIFVRAGIFQGRPAHFIVSLDVTETRNAQDALRRERDFVSAVLDTVGALIVVLDTSGHVVGWNAACEQLTGYSDSDALGARFADLVVPEGERAGIEKLLESMTKEAYPKGGFSRWKTSSGQIREIEWRNSVITNEKGEVEFLIGTGLDVTERMAAERDLHAMEAQLLQAQKLEAVGQLTGGIAHDFNNLLTAILAAAELAKEAVEKDPETARRDLEEIVKEGRRGARLVNKLMAFSRRESLERVPLDLAAVASDVERTFLRLLPESVAIELAIMGRTFPVLADRGALEQILVNLVTNARDAMPEGGVLRVTVKDGEHVPANEKGEPVPGATALPHVVVEVSDSGIGMDELTLSRIFEPFFTTKPMGRGTGLGLATVYGLVKKHDGFVEVESHVGKGTTFRLFFPRHEAKLEVVAAPKPDVEHRDAKGTILVVEDDSTIRRSVKRILERAGYRVELASDGQGALERFDADERYDLVVTDVIMPRLSGPKLYDAVRARGDATPFLFTSGYPADEMDRMESARPDLPILRKPWTAAHLLERVREAMGETDAA